jgi:hypothetical protein
MRVHETGKERLAGEVNALGQLYRFRNAARIIHEQALPGYEVTVLIKL